jgi:hypothetical protein
MSQRQFPRVTAVTFASMLEGHTVQGGLLRKRPSHSGRVSGVNEVTISGLARRLSVNTSSRTALEVAILRLLENENTGNLPEIVRELRSLADDASIKAALLRLNSEGLIQITSDWTFRAAAAAGAG